MNQTMPRSTPAGAFLLVAWGNTASASNAYVLADRGSWIIDGSRVFSVTCQPF
jgi:hypothetical protein